MSYLCCPHCHVRLAVVPGSVGLRTGCPNCRAAITVLRPRGNLVPTKLRDDCLVPVLTELPYPYAVATQPVWPAGSPVEFVDAEWELEERQTKRRLLLMSLGTAAMVGLLAGTLVWVHIPEGPPRLPDTGVTDGFAPRNPGSPGQPGPADRANAQFGGAPTGTTVDTDPQSELWTAGTPESKGPRPDGSHGQEIGGASFSADRVGLVPLRSPTRIPVP